jgi:hypothetical protein
MLDPATLQSQMKDSIESDRLRRKARFQATVAQFKAAKAKASSQPPISGPAAVQSLLQGQPVAPTVPPEPLFMVAIGDSWFDYPIIDNDTSTYGNCTDIIKQLPSLATPTPNIFKLAHAGDATTAEMGLPKRQRLIATLIDPNNWPGGYPDAILISGGGDDIAGDQFCILLDSALDGPQGLNQVRLNLVLGAIEASYRDLFLLRNRYAPGVPIFGHTYDFPIPNGVHPFCAGPWLKPSLDECGWTDPVQARQIVQNVLLAFGARLKSLADDPANNFILIQTQNTLSDDSYWANELHPTEGGFGLLAQRFVRALHAKFGNRITLES